MKTIIDLLIEQATEIALIKILSNSDDFSFEIGVSEFITSGEVKYSFKMKTQKGELIYINSNRFNFLIDENKKKIIEEQKLQAGKEYIVFLSTKIQSNSKEVYKLVDRWLGVIPNQPYLYDYILKKNH